MSGGRPGFRRFRREWDGQHDMKCQNCNKTATVHLTEIKGGKKIEKHLCEQCAAQNEGLPVKSHMPINELLTNFVMAHSGLQKDLGQSCDGCGITWAEFRQNGLFGCAQDYTVFEKDLTPLLHPLDVGIDLRDFKCRRVVINPSHSLGIVQAEGSRGAGAKRRVI